MNRTWHEVVHDQRWRSPETVWVEDGLEYSWQQVDDLAATIEATVGRDETIRVLCIRSESKLGCFAGQLAAWRAGCVAVVDDGELESSELDRVRPDLTVVVGGHPPSTVQRRCPATEPLPHERIPEEVVAVNFTSGSTGSRKAVALTVRNFDALFACPDLDVTTGQPVSGSFATPTYDGWWFDTWKTVAAGGTVVCLPGVNDDVFVWPELAEKYGIDRVLLPAAVLATVVSSLPECIAGIPHLYSGGEQFHLSTYRRARDAGLTNRFTNLYGPTEATFATHKYDLPDRVRGGGTIPIGTPLAGCRQRLLEAVSSTEHSRELVVEGPLVCLGYVDDGSLKTRFHIIERGPSFHTGDVVRVDGDDNLVFAGRLDSQIKVNGTRVDVAALESEVSNLPGVSDCRVIQDDHGTVAFVRIAHETPAVTVHRKQIDSVITTFSSAIAVDCLEQFPVKAGGKVDAAALMSARRTARRNETHE